MEEGEWIVVPAKVALEKIKQGLREKKRKKEPGPVIEDAVSHAIQQDEEESSAIMQANANEAKGYSSIREFPNGLLPSHLPGGLPSTLLSTPFATSGPPIGDPRLFLFQNPPWFSSFPPNSFAHLSQAGLPQGPLSNEKLHFLFSKDFQSQKPSNVFESALSSTRDTRIGQVSQRSDTFDDRASAKVAASPDSPTFSSDSHADDALLALSALTKIDMPRFSEEQEAIEKASLTDAEHADIP